mgnify:CR=1 FL=1|jgi:putative Mn2+ efflux pump MntP
MCYLKIISGIILLIIGILFFKKAFNDRKRQGSYSEIVSKSVTFQSYISSIVIVAIGIGLIISCFYKWWQ